MSNLLKMNESDNVAVATDLLNAGDSLEIEGSSLQIRQDIPKGHKVALVDIAKGHAIVRYGNIIARAIEPIAQGDWVHVHNVFTTLSGEIEYSFSQSPRAENNKPPMRYFDGFLRPDGRAGIRNELWIIPTVFCVNGPAQTMANIFNARHPSSASFDGAFALPHSNGCSQVGLDLQYTQRVLANLAHHPNAGGVLLLGLGCESNCLEAFTPFLIEDKLQRVRMLNCQNVSDEIRAGMEILEELFSLMSTDCRESLPASKLAIAVNCGGSDTFSGITANPVVGQVTDTLTDLRGTVLMTEVPEMFGAEHLLMARAADRSVFEKIVEMINAYKRYFERYGVEIYKNPVHGNIQGGISTLEEKSLGNIQKGGYALVNDVLPYGGRLEKHGLCLMYGPGNDLAGITAQEAAGCVMTLFTTGRGTPAGYATPLLRVSSNSELTQRKPNWIDFDAGALMRGRPIEKAATELFDMVLNVASNRMKTCAEKNGYRQIGILRDGVTN